MRLLRRLFGVVVLLCFVLAVAAWAVHRDSSIRTEAWINCAPGQVWLVLTATAEYPGWNPMISQIDGELRPGNTITFTQGKGSDAMTFRPKIMSMRPAQELTWKGHLWIPGVFDAERHFSLEGQEGRTHFVQSETFSGLLAGKLTEDAVRDTAAQMDAMNAALKRRAEELAVRK